MSSNSSTPADRVTPSKRKNTFGLSQPMHQTNISLQPPPKKPRRSSSNSNSNNLLTNIQKNCNNNKIHTNTNTNSLNNTNTNPNTNLNNNNNQSVNDYRPTHIYSSQLPIESEKDIIKSYATSDKRINFSSIDYNSLIKYCNVYKLHNFTYNNHYHLAKNNSKSNYYNNNNNNEDDDISRNKKPLKNNKSSARMKEENDLDLNDDDIEINNNNNNKKEKHIRKHHKHKNKKKKKNKHNKNKKNNNKNDNNYALSDTQHHYFHSDLLDAHYCRKQRDFIPKTFDPQTRLTKTELVNMVKQHFLSTPILAEMDEMTIIRQFLLFIQQRRNKLKKELGLN